MVYWFIWLSQQAEADVTLWYQIRLIFSDIFLCLMFFQQIWCWKRFCYCKHQFLIFQYLFLQDSWCHWCSRRRGCKRIPKTFDLVKILEKSLNPGKNQWKFGQNVWKRSQNHCMCFDWTNTAPKFKVQTFFLEVRFLFRSFLLGKLGKIWAKMVLQVCLYLKKCAQHEKKCSHFFGGHFLWSFFLGTFGKIWAKILRTTKNLPAPTPMVGFKFTDHHKFKPSF